MPQHYSFDFKASLLASKYFFNVGGAATWKQIKKIVKI